jgi:hypothetical protein
MFTRAKALIDFVKQKEIWVVQTLNSYSLYFTHYDLFLTPY